MSGAAEAVTGWRAALLAALAAAPALGPLVNRVGDGEGEAAPVPWLQLGEIVAAPWGGAARPGVELSWSVTLADRGGAARVAALAAAAQDALLAMPRAIAGFETGGVALLRSRLSRRRDGLRLAVIDARVRMLAL